MAQLNTPCRRCIQNFGKAGQQARAAHSARGFTLVELLVAMSLGLMLLAMIAEITLSNRNLYGHDVVRTRLNQDLRGALDIVGINIREAGEDLTMTFPAVEIADGASGAPDTLTLRRNLLDEVLNLCTAITAGSSNTQIYFAVPGNVSGCTYASGLLNYTPWRNYRIAQAGARTKAFIYDTSTKKGEFFDYISEADTGTSLYLVRQNGTWANAYTVGSTAIYVIEEWQFSMTNAGVLQLVQNGDTSNPLKVAFGLQNFQVQANMQDSTTKTVFARTDDWTKIAALRTTISAQTTFRKQTISSNLSADFFPRNVLSN